MSPVLFAEICSSYRRAYRAVWKVEFANRHEFYWDASLLIRPVAQLLGVALEAGLKGLLAVRNIPVPKSHDIEQLLGLLSDSSLIEAIDASLTSLEVPARIIDANEDKPRSDIEDMYRRHHIHVHLLNRLYDRPFASRYPVLGGHSLPDPVALDNIVLVVLAFLDEEKRQWNGIK